MPEEDAGHLPLLVPTLFSETGILTQPDVLLS